ncbi:hypothetical protein WN51_05779 [Melipona quadrifasciata]|uniref:Chitin-binding type-2 domain-containing protein n=1 Tax=Melipona quadrifasciata TaxID=166423 RepID=A0A0M9A864_9HYME|nr:hypothetical protein WN51_05779 [Melipona quadrifasciata]
MGRQGNTSAFHGFTAPCSSVERKNVDPECFRCTWVSIAFDRQLGKNRETKEENELRLSIRCQRNPIPRSARASRNEAALEFECPEEFGYYPHPRDCTQYYVCVFGGALLESCTGGLMYRNVGRRNPVLLSIWIYDGRKEDSIILERISLPRLPQHNAYKRVGPQKRDPFDPKYTMITEKQIRQRQQARNYHENEYEPATEVESDRQQRVYRGQPSTIGQVQRDRDGLRRNVISEREKESLVSTRAQTEAHYRTQVPSSESPRVAKILASTVASVIPKSYYNDPDQSYPYYTIYDDDVSIYKDDDSMRKSFSIVIRDEFKKLEKCLPPLSLLLVKYNSGLHLIVNCKQSMKRCPLVDRNKRLESRLIVNASTKSSLRVRQIIGGVSRLDYNQYTVNQSVPVQSSVKISEVNTKQYQKPKKVAVNEADKYNLNQDVTVQDYDIYENQAQLNKNKFRITEGQSYRPNVLSHPVHVTTPNAIVDTFIPLTTTTQLPTTTNRPYTVNAPSRGRPQQIHRGTAPPRSRPTLKPSTEIVSKAQEFIDIYRYPPSRPAPIYPTPQVDKPAAKCRKDVCLLPDCSCGGADIPGGIPLEQTPQIVLLTFDDAVNDLNRPLYFDLFENGRKNPNGCPITATFYVSHEWTDYSQVQNLYADGHEMASHTVSRTRVACDYHPEEIPQIVLLTFDDSVNDLNKGLYVDLFEKGRKNPNGCPIAATFYVSHEWTDYSQVQNLYATGHEIASHTVSHSFGEQFSHRKWAREVAGQREILSAYGGVKLEDVRGMRAPFLSVGGNNMFKMLWDTNFTYDSSMPIYENRPPSWPYTLDYKLFHDCMIPPCPTRSYPGLWEVPMVMWQDLNGGRCSMGDACSNPPTADGVYKMLIKNFERHYTTNRAPFGLFYHAAWFTQPHHKEGFISFLDTIVAMDDVWIVTNWQAIQWVRNPTPLPLLHTFEPFGCNYPKKYTCKFNMNNPKVCNLWHKSGVRYMKTCQACPDIYPWTGKTGIRSSRIDNDVDAHE